MMGKATGPIYTDSDGRGYSPEAISALILRKLKDDAEAAFSEPITGAVITVPANFNDAQRQATLNAGRLADIPVLGLVEEPLAAATLFGLNTTAGERLRAARAGLHQRAKLQPRRPAERQWLRTEEARRAAPLEHSPERVD
jgi:molecular chaperone DnaK (HSP70)